ncbi:MAG TPA: hypothetical protein VGK19_19545 [Capsulimonadaceae bacterium]
MIAMWGAVAGLVAVGWCGAVTHHRAIFWACLLSVAAATVYIAGSDLRHHAFVSGVGIISSSVMASRNGKFLRR